MKSPPGGGRRMGITYLRLGSSVGFYPGVPVHVAISDGGAIRLNKLRNVRADRQVWDVGEQSRCCRLPCRDLQRRWCDRLGERHHDLPHVTPMIRSIVRMCSLSFSWRSSSSTRKKKPG